jgi:hypothetical protein
VHVKLRKRLLYDDVAKAETDNSYDGRTIVRKVSGVMPPCPKWKMKIVNKSSAYSAGIANSSGMNVPSHVWFGRCQ